MPQLLNKNSSFKVTEMVWLNFLIGGFFLFLFFIVYFSGMGDGARHLEHNNTAFYLLIPACIAIGRGIKNRTTILINKVGLYECGNLITNWNNFITAYSTNDDIPGSITDDIVVMIQFKKDKEVGSFLRKIKLSNTQNKDADEVLEAIHFYNNQHHCINSFVQQNS